MVECQTIGCKLAVGKNGRKGFCQKCYRKTLTNSANESLNSGVDTKNDSVAHLFSTPLASLNQSVLTPDITLVKDLTNAAFDNSSSSISNAIEDTVEETPPTSVEDLYHLFTRMRSEFTLIIKEKDATIASLTARVETLEKSTKNKASVNTSDVNIMKEMKEEYSSNMKTIKATVAAQQKTLENLQHDKRVKNLIITGVPEPEGSPLEARKEDESTVESIFTTVECPGVCPSSVTRLGRKRNPSPSNESNAVTEDLPPRPLLVTLNTVAEVRAVTSNGYKLKENNAFRKVYLKRDEHPLIRKEWNRLRTFAKKEKDAPINVGCLIKVDYQKKAVTRDGESILEFVSPFRGAGPNHSN